MFIQTAHFEVFCTCIKHLRLYLDGILQCFVHVFSPSIHNTEISLTPNIIQYSIVDVYSYLCETSPVNRCKHNCMKFSLKILNTIPKVMESKLICITCCLILNLEDLIM